MRSDGTNRTEFAPAAILGSPVGLALDWISENLYYTNPSVQSIEVRDPLRLSWVHLKLTQTKPKWCEVLRIIAYKRWDER